LYEELKLNPDPLKFYLLCENLIAEIIIFNCRRGGEVSRATMEDYLTIDFEGNLEFILCETELKAKDELTMFYVPGKRGRNVPILLTKSMKKCIDLIVTLRIEKQSKS
jgi:hypothetical protein